MGRLLSPDTVAAVSGGEEPGATCHSRPRFRRRLLRPHAGPPGLPADGVLRLLRGHHLQYPSGLCWPALGGVPGRQVLGLRGVSVPRGSGLPWPLASAVEGQVGTECDGRRALVRLCRAGRARSALGPLFPGPGPPGQRAAGSPREEGLSPGHLSLVAAGVQPRPVHEASLHRWLPPALRALNPPSWRWP